MLLFKSVIFKLNFHLKLQPEVFSPDAAHRANLLLCYIEAQDDHCIYFLSQYPYKDQIKEMKFDVTFLELKGGLKMIQLIRHFFLNVRAFYLQVISRVYNVRK